MPRNPAWDEESATAPVESGPTPFEQLVASQMASRKPKKKGWGEALTGLIPAIAPLVVGGLVGGKQGLALGGGIASNYLNKKHEEELADAAKDQSSFDALQNALLAQLAAKDKLKASQEFTAGQNKLMNEAKNERTDKIVKSKEQIAAESRASREKIAADKAAAVKNKPEKPEYSAQYMDTLWGQKIPAALKGDEKVRGATGQMAVTNVQVKRAKALFSRVPPPGTAMNDWAKKIDSDPEFIDRLDDKDRVNLLHNMTNAQMGELADAYIRTITGGVPNESDVNRILQRNFGSDAAKIKNYWMAFSSGKADRTAPAGQGLLANELFHGINAEHKVAQDVLWRAAKSSIIGHEKALKTDPDWESKLTRMINTQFGDDQVKEIFPASEFPPGTEIQVNKATGKKRALLPDGTTKEIP